MPRVIILTPIKNEEWILEQFLTISSLFADSIIIADQMSTDNSRAICSRYPKVFLIENINDEFNEAERQVLLIETARRLFPNDKRILFCLDADELFSANSLNDYNIWNNIKILNPGTSIYIEKPDILFGIQRCFRSQNNYAAIGYVDDGISHHPAKIHSIRIPNNTKGEKIYIDNLKILHFAHSRRNVQSSKLRYYSVVENIKNINPYYLRRFFYKCFYSEQRNYPPNSIEKIPQDWIKIWDEMNIDLRNFDDPEFSWHDYEVLRFFKKYGYKRFYLDDIWSFDWEACRLDALKKGLDVPTLFVKKPGRLVKLISQISDRSYEFSRKVRNI